MNVTYQHSSNSNLIDINGMLLCVFVLLGQNQKWDELLSFQL